MVSMLKSDSPGGPRLGTLTNWHRRDSGVLRRLECRSRIAQHAPRETMQPVKTWRCSIGQLRRAPLCVPIRCYTGCEERAAGSSTGAQPLARSAD